MKIAEAGPAVGKLRGRVGVGVGWGGAPTWSESGARSAELLGPRRAHDGRQKPDSEGVPEHGVRDDLLLFPLWDIRLELLLAPLPQVHPPLDVALLVVRAVVTGQVAGLAPTDLIHVHVEAAHLSSALGF